MWRCPEYREFIKRGATVVTTRLYVSTMHAKHRENDRDVPLAKLASCMCVGMHSSTCRSIILLSTINMPLLCVTCVEHLVICACSTHQTCFVHSKEGGGREEGRRKRGEGRGKKEGEGKILSYHVKPTSLQALAQQWLHVRGGEHA